MIALDTNILVRLLTNDDPIQAKKAALLIDSEQAFFVPLTVCLELEWLLRGAYGLEIKQLANSFEALLAIRNLSFESEVLIVQALGHYSKGIDFADALHLASASKCDSLVTLDKNFAKKSLKLKTVPIVELL